MITLADILNASILVVDDLAANVAVLEQTLRGAGYLSVASTMKPQEVCELHRRHRYDLIVLDLQMPGMDGFEVMQGLKEVETGGYLPVLVMTAQPAHKLRALKAGARDFISKPFDLGEVLMRVHNLLEVRLLHRSVTLLNLARLENSQRIAGLGDWEHDFVNGRLLWSEGIYRILGLERHSTAPDAEIFYALVHPDDRASVREKKKTAAESLGRVEFEYRIVRGDGVVRHIYEIDEMLLDELKRPVRTSGTLQDVSERKRVAEALGQSEERYRLMFESNPSPIWAFDLKTLRFLAVNDAAVALYGYSREDFFRMTAADIRPPVDIAEFVRHTTALPATFQAAGRSRHRKKDGTVFPVDIYAHGISFAGRPARLVLAVDRTEAEHTANALRASEARFRALSESAPIGIFECDAAGGVVYCNPAMAATSGRPAAASLGDGWQNSIHPRDRRAMKAAWRRVVTRGILADRELCIVPPDGSLRWVHFLAAPSKNAEGQVIGFSGTVEDITERRAAGEDLREKTALLEAQIESSLDGILIVDPTGKRILQNSRYIELMQIPREIAEAKDDGAARHAVLAMTRQPEAILEKVLQLYAHPEESSWDEIELINGTVLDRHSSPIISREGRNYGRIWAFRDVTANKAADRALRESEERFKFVARAVSDAVWDWDLVADTMWWNDGFMTTFGFAAGEIQPGVAAWKSRIHSDDRAQVVQSMREAIDGGAESWSADYRCRRKDGSHAFVQDQGFILRDKAGKGLRMVGGMRDLTERKRLEEHFLQAQKMEALGQFSGGVAHDFNNILAAISGYTELARMILKENPEVRDHLGAVLEASGRAADLVKQILTFSRQQPQERRAIRLQAIVTESLKLMRATIPSTIEFDVAIAADAPVVLANANQIHQVLMNLGTNAWHAMKEGTGRLQVKLERCVVDTAHAATQPRLRPGLYARVSVSDTGSGMDRATLRRIFEPFFTTKPPGEGTGLGLAVVHGIMDSHDGAVTVYSQLGEGTVFHLYFPAHAGEVSEIVTEETPTPRGHGERILVVDDEELLARLGQKTLAALGYEVECVTESAAALAAVTADPARFALVVTDQTMPGMTGLMLAGQLRQIRPGLPLVLMTGYSATLTPERLAEAGIRQLLIKPTGIHALGTAVHEALSAGALS